MASLSNQSDEAQTTIPAQTRYIVKVLETQMLTHNVRHFVVQKPPGYTFVSGQATDISINKPGLEEELRPFTFTSINASEHLEFIIKIYTGHDGLTEKLGEINAGDELILHEIFGTITYKGPGLFLAGGAGITPFISIFRQLKKENKLSGNTLLFANRTADDVILGDELRDLLSDNYHDVLEITSDPANPGKFIDRTLLQRYVKQADQHYYICGPDKFVSIMVDTLLDLGVQRSNIVIEE
jgi:ferredoxin-NADP reductase